MENGAAAYWRFRDDWLPDPESDDRSGFGVPGPFDDLMTAENRKIDHTYCIKVLNCISCERFREGGKFKTKAPKYKTQASKTEATEALF